MTIEHSAITDPFIHEPKGATTAAADTVYVATGSGSGTWKKVDSAAINISDLEDTIQDDIDDGTLDLNGYFYLCGVLADVSAASSVLIPIKDNCTVVSAEFVLGGAITGADDAVNIKNSAGTSMGTNVTVANSASAKGDKYAWTATGSNSLTGPTWIEVTSDGASSTTATLGFIIKFSATLN